MIFTPLVKNKLASLLVLPQQGCSTGNHQGVKNGKKKEKKERGMEGSARKVYFFRVVIDGVERRRGSEERGPQGKQSMAQVVISKTCKIKQGRQHNDCQYTPDVLAAMFGRCLRKTRMMHRGKRSGFELEAGL